jgi:hypothetical protein
MQVISMDNLYDMVKDNEAFRKQKGRGARDRIRIADSVSLAPNVPKNSAKTKTKKAA